jgi:hypothetical protein
MPRPRSGSELESLRAQAQTLEQRIRAVAAREKAKQAQEDHRRWQMAGQCAVLKMQTEPDGEFFKTMMGLLDRHARSASDRALFGLPAATATNGKSADEPGKVS